MYQWPLCVLVALLSMPFSSRSVAQSPASNSTKPTRVRTVDELADRKVTLELKDATLKEALDALFKKAPVNRVVMFDTSVETKITFKVEDVPFEGALACILAAAKRVPLTYAADRDIVVISPDPHRGGSLASGTRVWMDLKDVDAKQAVGVLMHSSHANYTMDAGASGQISVALAGEPVDAALKRLCENKTSPITFTVDDQGTYRFTGSR